MSEALDLPIQLLREYGEALPTSITCSVLAQVATWKTWRYVRWSRTLVSNGESLTLYVLAECPRQESNLRTWLRRPMLYPLSYGGNVLQLLEFPVRANRVGPVWCTKSGESLGKPTSPTENYLAQCTSSR
jgi:hypothetical protein